MIKTHYARMTNLQLIFFLHILGVVSSISSSKAVLVTNSTMILPSVPCFDSQVNTV